MTDSNHDRRVFLGLDQPPLVSAVNWLVEHQLAQTAPAAGDSVEPVTKIDMDNVLLVLPTTRSTERILQLLVTETDQRDLEFIPPIITTVGQLPEFFYDAKKQLASDLAQQLAWSQALQQTPAAELKLITGRADVEDLQDWQPLATLISQLHTRLANDIWSFRSVAREVKKQVSFLDPEADRWDALNAMQRRYYEILTSVNLWDRQAARNFAASGLLKNNEIRCATKRDVVVIGAADLNRSVTEMLRQVATTNPEQVNILVAADASMADRFNDFGCLITEKWLAASPNLDDKQILVVDQPADQADATAFYISQASADIATDEITIGVPDPNIVPQLCRSLSAIGVPYRSLIGRGLNETLPVRLMLAAKEYLESQTYDTFATLVRHPDVFAWLTKEIGNDRWLHDLDQHQNEYLPYTVALADKHAFGEPRELATDFHATDEADRKRAQGRGKVATKLNKIHQLIADLLKPLVGPPQPIAQWTQPWSEILIAVYGSRTMNSKVYADRQIIKACETIYQALGNQRQVPPEFKTSTSASQALEWAIQAATETRVVSPPTPNAIELAGWLDLALDDAPVMVVTSMNDEHVPASEVGHQFLPDELCRQLGILDNDRRYARDMYALTVIASVRENLQLIVGRRNEKGDPKKPSRLLFACDAATAARRAKAFFEYENQQTSEMWITNRTDFPSSQELVIPEPICTQPLEKLSVTKFKSFLECPYRFYLKHVLKLDSITDNWRELSGGTFGDLCHNVLEAFALNDAKELDDPDRILEFWNDQLDTMVARKYVGSRLPALRIQVEQLRFRFEKLAPLQAERRRNGWQIVSAEEMLEHEFMVDGDPFIIRGKIDRVDRHEQTGLIAVWDYKSSDRGVPAEKAHYRPRKQEWVDLQLPLYRHLVKEVEVVADADFNRVTTGYVLMPKKLEDVGFDRTNWRPEELHAADEKAREIIRKIRASAYWPPVEKPPKFSDAYAAICQDNAFEQFNVATVEEVAPW